MPLLNHELAGIGHLRHFFAENEKPARRLLKRIYPNVSQSEFVITEIGKHADVYEAMQNLRKYASLNDCGLVSDCGVPAVADPGAVLVAEAHRLAMQVIPFVGPSSILLTLMASGFNGQSFVFHGYPPLDTVQRTRFLQKVESDAIRLNQTQLFMETPFRNMPLLKQILSTLKPDTRLCLGAGIHTKGQFFKSLKVSEWKLQAVDIHKIPAIFAVYAS